MFCRYCGEKLYEDAFFCTNCGTPVNQMDLPVRKAAFTPGEGADVQETSETMESICKMQPVTAVQVAETPVQDIEVPKLQMTVDTSVEPKTETQERIDMSVEPETPTQLSAPLQETVTEAAGQQETTKQPEPAEATAADVAPVEETVTEAVRQQETPKQPASPEASESAAVTAAEQQDAVPYQAISAGSPEFSQPRKLRARSNAVLIIVTVVAAVLFLAGVWGAIYFSSGDDELFYSRGNLLTETGVGGFFPL